LSKADVDYFLGTLGLSVTRQVVSVTVLPLHGNQFVLTKIDDAIEFLKNYTEDQQQDLPFVKYEIIIKYSTGAVYNGTMMNKIEAIDFLERNAKGLH
jgi:hypothetical protein